MVMPVKRFTGTENLTIDPQAGLILPVVSRYTPYKTDTGAQQKMPEELKALRYLLLNKDKLGVGGDQLRAIYQSHQHDLHLIVPEWFGGTPPSLEEYPTDYKPGWADAALAGPRGGSSGSPSFENPNAGADTSHMSAYRAYQYTHGVVGEENPFYQQALTQFGGGIGGKGAGVIPGMAAPPEPEPTYFSNENDYGNYLKSKGLTGALDVTGLFQEYKNALPEGGPLRIVSIVPVEVNNLEMFPGMRAGDKAAVLSSGETVPIDKDTAAFWTGKLPSTQVLSQMAPGSIYVGEKWTGQYGTKERQGSIVSLPQEYRQLAVQPLQGASVAGLRKAEEGLAAVNEDYEIRRREMALARVFPVGEKPENVVAWLLASPDNRATFLDYLHAQGPNEDTVGILVDLFPRITQTEVNEIFAGPAIPVVPELAQAPAFAQDTSREVTMGPSNLPGEKPRVTMGPSELPGEKQGVPTADQFNAQYFAEKGWDYDYSKIVRAAPKEQARLKAEYSQRQAEASAEYQKRYGTGNVLRSAGAKVAELVSPYAAKKFVQPTSEEPSTLEKALLPVDIATLLPFGMIFKGGKFVAEAWNVAKITDKVEMVKAAGMEGKVASKAATELNEQEIKALSEQAATKAEQAIPKAGKEYSRLVKVTTQLDAEEAELVKQWNTAVDTFGLESKEVKDIDILITQKKAQIKEVLAQRNQAAVKQQGEIDASRAESTIPKAEAGIKGNEQAIATFTEQVGKPEFITAETKVRTPTFNSLVTSTYNSELKGNVKNVHIGAVNGKPAWADGFMLEIKPVPEKLKATKGYRPVSKSVEGKSRDFTNLVPEYGAEAKEATPILRISPDPTKRIGTTYNMDRAFLTSVDGSVYSAMDTKYFNYFKANYPDAKFIVKDAKSPIVVQSKGKTVGVVMPIFQEDSIFNAVLELAGKRTIVPPEVMVKGADGVYRAPSQMAKAEVPITEPTPPTPIPEVKPTTPVPKLEGQGVEAAGVKGATVWEDKVYRSETGYSHGKETAADVIRYEQETLGNKLGVTPEIVSQLEDRPATDVVWVTKSKTAAKHYGTPTEITLPPGSKVLAEDGDGGYLILKGNTVEPIPTVKEKLTVQSSVSGTVPPVEPPKPPPPNIPEPSPSITPGPMAENVIGLRTIEPGLTRGQTIGNIFKRTVSGITTKLGGKPMVEYDPLANPAFTERARVRTTIESKANVLGTKADAEINKAFKLDKQGRVTDLAGVSPDISGAPTIADIAARLPVYELSLTTEQKAALSGLREALAPYRDLMTEVGVELRTRGDIIEGGFYIPRSGAELEGVTPPLKIAGGRGGMKKGFEKPAKFDSQAQGISLGYEYPGIGQAITEYAYNAGTRATDAHVANYFKALTDETGKFLGQTPKMRLMEHNPEIVKKLDEVNKLLDKVKRNIASLTDKELNIIDLWQHDPEYTNLDELLSSLDVKVPKEYLAFGKYPVKSKSPLAGMGMEDLQNTFDMAKATLRDLKPEYQRALRIATATPRDQGVIILPALAGRTFPNEIANAANVILQKEGKTVGALAPAVNTVNAFNNLYRGLRATLDNSALGIQGLLGMYGDPKAYAEALKLNIKAWGIGGDKALGKFLSEFDTIATKADRLTSDVWAKAGLHQGGAMSEFAIGIGSKIGELPGVRQANRAFGYFGDALRLEWADNELAGLLKKRTLDEIRKSGDLERIANAANTMTGWSAGKTFGSVGDLVLFAPRFLQSRLETVAKGAMGLRPGASLDQQIARNSLLKMIGFGTMVTVGANMVQGEETDFRVFIDGKRNPKFMRVKYDDKYYSVFGTWDSLVAMTLNVGTGKPLQALRNQGSGLTTAAFDLISGTDYNYKPTRDTFPHFAQWVLGNMIPFSAGQLPQAVGEMGKGISEADLAKTAAGGIQAVSQIVGVKSFPSEDWNVNALRLGLPKSKDPALLSTENPNYLTNNYYSDTLAQLRNTSSEEVAKNKDFPARVKSISATHELNKTTDQIPHENLTSIPATPFDKNGKKQDTFTDYYNMWEHALTIKDDKEFDKYVKETQAYRGNFSQRQLVLLQQYHQISPTDTKGREQFLIDNPEINVDPREEYLKDHPDDNAKLALWGQAKIYSSKAYDKAMALAKDLDIPDAALPDMGVPKDEETRKVFFDWQGAKEKFGGTTSPEARLIMARSVSLQKFHDAKAKITPNAYLGTPIPALEIDVNNRKLNDQYDALTSDKDRDAFKQSNPKYTDDLARIAAYKAQFKYDNTVADKKTIESVVEYGKKAEGNEQTLYRADNPQFDALWSKVKGWQPLDSKNIDALRLKVKNQALTEQYDALSTPVLKEHFLRANPTYATDRIKTDAFSKGFTGGLVDQYVEYQGKKTGGQFNATPYDESWYLLEHLDLYRNLTISGEMVPKNFTKVPSRTVYALFQQYLRLPQNALAREQFRRAYPNLNMWMMAAQGYKSLTSLTTTPAAVSQTRRPQPVATRQPVPQRVVAPYRAKPASRKSTVTALKRVGVLR
jgi:hypothetical protein